MGAGCGVFLLCTQYQGAEEGESLQVWGQLGLLIELQASQGYVEQACLKKEKGKTKQWEGNSDECVRWWPGWRHSASLPPSTFLPQGYHVASSMKGESLPHGCSLNRTWFPTHRASIPGSDSPCTQKPLGMRREVWCRSQVPAEERTHTTVSSGFTLVKD